MTKTGLLRSALATLVALSIGVGFSAAQKQTHVVIMHTNDIHGHVLPENGAGGLAMIAAMVKQAKPDLLLDAGDMFTGTLLSDTFHGEPVMALMNRMGYRASILGNHEFDYGLGMLRIRVKQAKFPILSANVVLPYKDVGQTTVIEVKGIRFGIVGLTTEEAPITTHPKFMKNVTVRELVKTLEETLPQLQARSDFIIVLGHLRADEELRIARAFPAINLIIGGHIGELAEPIREKNTMIVRTGDSANTSGAWIWTLRTAIL
jgi:5'-nucleotidase/UDP-sugar diphosphatase